MIYDDQSLLFATIEMSDYCPVHQAFEPLHGTLRHRIGVEFHLRAIAPDMDTTTSKQTRPRNTGLD